ncbi:hypothetical protein ERO13_D06G213200v2 [Gossypium hirsutum]|uniref:Uncharacterized protein n=1 Tax=Gossypium raimondii TaxID=29730 RepID=A0A7J8QAZ4_GOSRA|nr:hypothetical protein ERO13_D06G213200v2 [Gossypium hirsutum]MBA0598755.1 hypothetical protein [Gossypium raimondii]
MEIQSASFASSKCIKMPSTVTPVLIPKAYARCAVSKCSTPSFTSRVTYNRRGI